MVETSIEWPSCVACGGPNWKVNRIPQKSGVEDQFFTCGVCGHITERQVRMTSEDLAKLRDDLTGEAGRHVPGK